MNRPDNSFLFHTFGRSVPSPSWPISGTCQVNRLYYIYTGKAYLIQAGQEDRLLAVQHWYLFPEQYSFHIRQSAEYPVDHIFFDFTVVPGLLARSWMDLTRLNDPVLDAALHAAGCFAEQHPFRSCGPNELALVSAYLNICFSLISASVELPRLQEARITTAIQYMQAHASEDISVQALATLTHTDEDHFIRLFHRMMGITPYQYLKNIRLNKAVYELQRGSTVSEAAVYAGYQSVSAFSKTFHHVFGYPPRDYIAGSQNQKTGISCFSDKSGKESHADPFNESHPSGCAGALSSPDKMFSGDAGKISGR